MGNLSSFCIYTMRHSAQLQAQTRTSGAHVLTEGKAWTTGHLLWDQARRSGERMPLIFSAAEDDTGLIYWATIEDITKPGSVQASGRPVSPSQHTMHTSATPRPFSSLSTVSQNFADSPVVGPTHRPSTCLAPSQSMPMAR